MPWRRSERLKPPTSPLPVPDAESVRRAALMASWQRDRRIAQRRLAWRWLLWCVGRYLLPALALLVALLLAAWLIRSQFLQQEDSRGAALEPAMAGTPRQVPQAQPAPREPAASLIPATTYLGLPPLDAAALQLRPVTGLGTAPTPASVAAAAGVDDTASEDRSPSPLKPENWLHSKEP